MIQTTALIEGNKYGFQISENNTVEDLYNLMKKQVPEIHERSFICYGQKTLVIEKQKNSLLTEVGILRKKDSKWIVEKLSVLPEVSLGYNH
jgi:hypothetical protein